MGVSRDRRLDEIADLRRKLAMAAQQLDEIEARAQRRILSATDSKDGPESSGPLADTETRFAALVAIGLSRLSSRLP